MLAFFFSLSAPLLFFTSSPLFTPSLLFTSWIYFIFFSHSSYFNIPVSINSLYLDEVSFFMLYMTVFVLFMSYIYSYSNSNIFSLNVVFFFMYVFCFYVFTTNSVFWLYFSYEASLLPIVYIIVKWGSYPDRSLSAIMLFIYTAVFTFPFLVVIFYLFTTLHSFNFYFLSHFNDFTSSPLVTLIIFLAFAVKLPMYGLHFWLPMAHVEAPTFGSIILAGVLLKLGGVGLIRMSFFLNLQFLNSCMLSYLIIFMLYVTVVCMFQSDFKRLVAYSSVSHIMAIPILLISDNILSLKSFVILIFMHGLSSPLLFMIVGVVYSFYSSRQLITVRGVHLISPLLAMVIILAFFFSLSAPPFPSFLSEIYFIISSFYLTIYFIPCFIIFAFMSLVYNLNWLSSMVFSSPSFSVNYSYGLTYKSFMPMITSILICIAILLLVSFF